MNNLGCIGKHNEPLPIVKRTIEIQEKIIWIKIYIMDRKCILEGCNKMSSFNIPIETTGLYCNEHKIIFMCLFISFK